jgi:hypothetical protein
MSLTGTSMIVATRSLVSSDLGQGERIILSIDRGLYFGVEGVGSFIWDLIQDPVSIADVRSAVVSEYDVDPARAGEDVSRFVGDLISNDLARVVHAEASGVRPSRPG